jgi:hypothetical protein
MHPLLSILLLFPLVAHTQEPARTFQNDHLYHHTYWASAADSVDFTAFRSALRPTDPSQDGDTATVSYRLVWLMKEHGGIAAISRGDSSELRLAGRTLLGFFESIPFRLSDGRRGVTVVHDTPCGLICRDTMYYVEDRP